MVATVNQLGDPMYSKDSSRERRSNFKSRWMIVLLVVSLALLPLGSFAEERADLPGSDSPRLASKSLAGWSPIEPLVTAELKRLLSASDSELKSGLSKVYSFDHFITLDDATVVHVTEHFTLSSWLRQVRRGAVFLSGSVFKGNHWSIPVEGYDATRMFAEKGVFAFTVDHLGVGQTSAPEDGSAITLEANVKMVQGAIEVLRQARGISRFDVVGAGYGGGVAAHLAADDKLIRSCVLTAMLYIDLAGGPLADDNFIDFLQNAVDGYIFFPPEAYLPVTGSALPEVRQYVLETQPGIYPVHNFLVATDLPFFDPGVARVPGLVIYGSEDTVGGPADPVALATDYGEDGAELVILEGGSHAARMDPPEIAAEFWRVIFDFLDL